MGKVSIDFSLKNIWKSWFAFRRGKKITKEIDDFSYHLEERLYNLCKELNRGTYHHGGYHTFTVVDNKPRVISVASLRDRVVHRLMYAYLTSIYDKTFIYDVWSCRKHKGLVGAIQRTQTFLRNNHKDFIWRADIAKFFDNVDKQTLINIIKRRVSDPKALWLLEKIIFSYPDSILSKDIKCVAKSIPIGNLTSQIFANIYLNELDRFVVHMLHPKHYLRYGDDFIIISKDKMKVIVYRKQIITFLKESLHLVINPKYDKILRVNEGIHFLGVEMFSTGRSLKSRNWQQVKQRLNTKNAGSYSGLIKQHSNEKTIKEFDWMILEKLNEELY